MSLYFRIGNAVPEDAEAISVIERQVFSVPWSRNLIDQSIDLPDGVFLTAKNENDELIGYVSGQQVLDEFYINNLAVTPVFQRHGIGRVLMKTIVDHAKRAGCSFVSLEVRESNTRARKLYESFGFVSVGVRKNYYQHPQENAMIYTLFFEETESSL